jgi:hypothetical protein
LTQASLAQAVFPHASFAQAILARGQPIATRILASLSESVIVKVPE